MKRNGLIIFYARILKKLVEAKLLLQLEITIKAKLNKMFGYMIMKEIYVFF